MTRTLTATVSLTLFVAAGIGAQARPDFSGTWVYDGAKSRAANGAPSSGGGTMAVRGTGPAATLTITQDRRQLSIERVAGDQKTTTVYALDGSESVNATGRSTTRLKSRWDGATLVSEGTQTVSIDGADRTTSLKEVRSIDKEGNLRIETTRTLPSGARTSVAIYTRQK